MPWSNVSFRFRLQATRSERLPNSLFRLCTHKFYRTHAKIGILVRSYSLRQPILLNSMSLI